VSGYEINGATGLCEEVKPVILGPADPQARNSNRSAVSVVQGGSGLLTLLQAQSGTDTSTRQRVFSVDRTGLQIGYDPDSSKLGIDLSAAGGQNLVFGIARSLGADPFLDALLLLQTKESDGSIVDRLRVNGVGDLTASGNVRGAQLCIGGSCKNSWSAVVPPAVSLQAATPGTADSGSFNVSGTGRMAVLTVGGSASVGLLSTSGGIRAGSGNVNIVDASGRVPEISSTYFGNLSGANLTGLNASNLASGTVADARLPSNLVHTTQDAGDSNGGPWVTLQGGASVLGNIALRLYDAGTADANVNVLEFAHSNGTGPVMVAKIMSTNIGVNAVNGAKLTLATASNNTGTINTDQLVLDRAGNVGMGTASPNTKLSVYSGDESTTLTDYTQALTKAGINIITDYTSGAYTPGIFWSTQDNRATKPKAGIWLQEDGAGTDMLFGTSSSYATGITNTALTIDQVGNVSAGGDVSADGEMTSKNSYECVNVGSELRCNLRQYWRTADKTPGYVESWVGSDTCTATCASAGLRTCSDIQYNYECPNGTLLNSSWRDDNPGEFSGSGQTCASSAVYRSTDAGATCAGQAGTVYRRYRCRCES